MCSVDFRLADDRFSSQLADDLDFLLPIGSSVRVKDFVKPDGWFFQNVWPLPGIPWKIGLRFTRYESPINGGDVMLFRNRQDCVERASGRACHILRADYRPMITRKPPNTVFKILRPRIIVERNHVGLF